MHNPLIVAASASVRLAERLTGLSLSQLQFIRGPSLWATDALMIGYLALVVVVAGWPWRFIETPGRRMVRRRPAAPLLAAQAA